MNKNKLIVFVKNPELGKVKTRLAKSIGNEAALRVYNTLTEITKNESLGVDAAKEVWYSNFVDVNDSWEADKFGKEVQSGENLGVRMKNAFQLSLEVQGFERVVLIGSDCPKLTSRILQEALESLKINDAVIGPAEDGGYYLIGMSTFIPSLFDNINWSTETVYSDTISELNNKTKSYHTLPTLFDVDTIDELKRTNIKV